jgi:hypothetical protein
MTEYFRKDAESIPVPQESSFPSASERINERSVPDPDKRPLVVPPPADTLPANVTSQPGGVGVAATRAPEQDRIALFVPNEANEFRSRWDSIQVGFVDQPRKAVEDADALVAATMSRLADIFSAERQKLERQWEKSENISTEDLRITLQKYRSFFGRLLSI